MSRPEPSQPLGRKIAAERQRRGLSQAQLAGLIGRSVAWVSQVERGARMIDRISVLDLVARALDVPLAELAAGTPVAAALTEEPAGAGGLRLVLSGVHSLPPMVSGGGPADLASLQAQASLAWNLTHASRYAELTDLLAVLIPGLEEAAQGAATADRPSVQEVMATVYQTTSAALAKLGDAEAAWIAADRAIAAAGRTGRPELVAAGAYRQVFVFLAARSLDQAEETARTAADAIAPLAGRGEAEAVSLVGGLTLQRGVIAARRGDADAAYRFLDEARVLAGRLGNGRGGHHTEFGPVNVVLHEVAIAVELGDAGRALRTAAGLDTAGLSPERRARLLLDVARAHAQRRQPAEATAALLAADELTPEQVRSHGLARQLATDLLGWLQPPPAELRALAARLGQPEPQSSQDVASQDAPNEDPPPPP